MMYLISDMAASWINFFYTGLDQLPPKYVIFFK